MITLYMLFGGRMTNWNIFGQNLACPHRHTAPPSPRGTDENEENY